jgi:hypothetical protein
MFDLPDDLINDIVIKEFLDIVEKLPSNSLETILSKIEVELRERDYFEESL